MDVVDLQILTILQEDGRTSNAEIARRVGMAPSAVFERIRKLEERGVIDGYTARLRPEALDRRLTAFIFVRTDDRIGSNDTALRLTEIPEIQEVHHVAGEDCYLVKVRVADPGALARLIRERLGQLSGIVSTRTTVVLETLKETTSLPIPEHDLE